MTTPKPIRALALLATSLCLLAGPGQAADMGLIDNRIRISDPRRLVSRSALQHGVSTQKGRDLFDETHAALPLHSRQACRGTTLPGFTRSWGSKTRRTACIAARESGSKIDGM